MQLYRLGLSLAVAFLLNACGAASSTTLTTQKLHVTAKEFAYTPTTLEITSGQLIEITLQNTGAVEHDFSVTEIDLVASRTSADEAQSAHMMGGMGEQPKLHVAAAAGGQSTLIFTPTKPGQYQFYCTVAGHKDAGMSGVLTVK
jgi:uncharacterized cupredoxin-like copper-binding protein